MFKPLPNLFKKIVKERGGFIYGPGSVPKGVNVFHDIQRYRWPGSSCSGLPSLILDVGANVGQFASTALTALPYCSSLVLSRLPDLSSNSS
jgi:hypothetical protein